MLEEIKITPFPPHWSIFSVAMYNKPLYNYMGNIC